MATQRTNEEKSAILAHCLELEREGGDILAYLWSENYLTPRATWINYQREWLGRKPYQYTDGKPRKDKKMPRKRVVTDEIREAAVNAYLAGGQPCTVLRSAGIKNPSSVWFNIKKKLEAEHPEVAGKIKAMEPEKKSATEPLQLDAGSNYYISVKDAMDNMQDAAEKFYGKCEEAGLKMGKITAPISYDGFKVRGISGQFGSYHFQDINGKQWIDYEDNDGSNELSMTVEQWRGFLDELHRAVLVLGVEL